MKKEFLAVFIGLVCLLLSLPIGATGLDDDLKPLLINVIGWQAQKAIDTRTLVSGMQTINVSRSYKRASKDVEAMIIVGANAMAYQGNMAEVSTETADGSVRISKVNGFQVQSVFDKKEKAGAVIIFLARNRRASSAVFMISYNGLSESDALAMARNFPWARIRRAVTSLM